jgi:uncharacterized protein (TIGR02145 family)
MKTVKIGKQTWGLNNLTLKKFSNGEDIHQCTNKENWEECGLIQQPAWCYYNFDEENEKFGLLYNGYVFMDPSGISQEGFRVADFGDFNILNDFIGGKENVDMLKSSSLWEKVTTENDITTIEKLSFNDDFGFKCLPSGWVGPQGDFYQLGSISKLWTSTDDDTGLLWARIIGYRFTSTPVQPQNGYSARFIKDEEVD